MPSRSLTAVAELGARQALHRHVARDRDDRGAIELAFHPGHERVDLRLIRLAASGRRHQASAQLAHGLFPDIGMVADRVERQRVERKTSGMPAVVAAGAVRVDHGARLRRAALFLAQGAGHDGDGETKAEEASHRARAPAEQMIALPEFRTSDLGARQDFGTRYVVSAPCSCYHQKPVRCAWRASV